MDLTISERMHSLLGRGSSEPRPFVLEASPSEAPTDADPEKAFAIDAGAALKRMTGLRYDAQEGAFITLDSVRGLAIDPTTEELEAVAPVIVVYSGKAAPENWAKAEKAYEQEFVDTIKGVAVEYMDKPKVRLVKRKKADPFSQDPRSLTLLRFRITEEA